MGGAATHPLLKPHQLQISSPQTPLSHRAAGGGRVDYFPKGSVVEVRTDDEDFRDVFFSATVILPARASPKKGSKQKSGKIYLEYHNLLAQDGGSKPLREYVDVQFVRPAPPLQEIVEGFEPDDVVDAFYRDGWWIGVVTRVVEGGERFVVTFQHPPDELEFGLSDLRVHWDWVNGSWVRPEKQSIAGLMFDVGRKVEVSFDREDCQDAWFPATIHQDLGNGTYLVEYCTANIDNKAQNLIVAVDSVHVRPCPPLLKDKNFVLLEKVDALSDFGWWSGVITKELENNRYIVFFKQMKRDKEFNQSELRPHMEWKDGKWFTSSQDVAVPSSDDGMHEPQTCKNSSASVPTVPVNNLGDRKGTSDGKTPSSLTPRKGHSEQLTPDIEKTPRVTSLTKRRQHSSDSRNALSQPLKKLKEGTVSPVSVNNIETPRTRSATADHSDNPSWGKRIICCSKFMQRRKQGNVDAVRNVCENVNSTSSYMKKSRTQTRQLEIPELDAGGKEPDVVGNTAEGVQIERLKKEKEIPVIIGLPCAEKGSSEFGKSRGKRSRGANSKEIVNIVSNQKQQLHTETDTVLKIKDKQLQTVEYIEIRKRGRPRRKVESSQTPVTGNVQNGVVGSDDLNKKDDDPHRIPESMASNNDKLNNGQSDPKNRKGTVTKRTLARKHEETVVKESTSSRENPPSKRGRRRVTGEKIAPKVQDSLGASGEKLTEVNCALEVDKVVCEAPSNDFDDEPLSKWIEGMHSPSAIDGSRLSAASVVEPCVENGGKQGDGVTAEVVSDKQQESEIPTSAAVVDKSSIVPTEQQSLPFVKNNFLWNTIESMEVFRKIPQNPHFQPLVNFKESSREGLAIGYMVTFCSVVENTSNLKFDDPTSITDDILETLADLEKHGFDVGALQNRVTELLAVKDKEEKLAGEVKEFKDQILEHRNKKNRIEEEIEEINEQIRKLQEKLLLAESAKGKEDDEIASLGAKLQKTEDSIKNVRVEFEASCSSRQQMSDAIITMEANSNSADFNSNTLIICRVCEKQFSQYTCPRCNIRYCSLHCYKSHSLRCTESFMRENVMGELQQLQPDEESKSKMLDILKRFHEEEETDSMDEEALDSSFSEETIQKILSGGQITFDDLSAEEKKHFQRAVASGELSKLIEPWDPWWLKPSAKYISLSSDGTQLVQPITNGQLAESENDVDSDKQLEIPPGPETPLPPVSKLTASGPSPLLAIHLIDIIYSYCFTLRLYNGDWRADPLESAMVVLSVSSVLSQSGQPETVLEALLHCLEQTCSPAYKHMGGMRFGLMLMDDVVRLLCLGGDALVCLLCDMRRIIQTAVRELKSEKLDKSRRAEVKSKIKSAERKIYFIMCWVHEQPSQVWSSLAGIVDTEKSSAMEYAESKKGAVRLEEKTGIRVKPLIKEIE